MPQRRGDAVDDAMVERALKTRRPRLAFAPPLEKFFENETRAARSRMMFWQGLVGLAVYLLLLVTDLRLTPDVFPLAVAIRVGIVGPFIVVALVMLLFDPLPLLREGVMALVAVLAGFSSLYLMLESTSPLRDAQSADVILAMLFVTILQRVRFPFAVISSLVLLVGYVLAILALPDYPPERTVQACLVFGTATALALIGSWTLERELRRGYLLWLKERRVFSGLADVSLRDPMTGLGNSRALDHALAELETADEDEDVAIVLVDIDHYKAYTDALGPPAGEAALRRIAALLRNSVRRETDHLFHFIGEEFLLLLRRTDLAAAVMLAERLRLLIEAEGLWQPDIPGKILTASFGVAAAKLGSEISFDELIAGADTALYAAKRSGGNQVWPPLVASRAQQVLRMRKTVG